jgi:hypothetical protein
MSKTKIDTIAPTHYTLGLVVVLRHAIERPRQCYCRGASGVCEGCTSQGVPWRPSPGRMAQPSVHSDAAAGAGVRGTVRHLALPSFEAPPASATLQMPTTARDRRLLRPVVTLMSAAW